MKCYVCGKPLGLVFNLMTYNEDTDRVFLVCNLDAAKVEPEVKIIQVAKQ